MCQSFQAKPVRAEVPECPGCLRPTAMGEAGTLSVLWEPRHGTHDRRGRAVSMEGRNVCCWQRRVSAHKQHEREGSSERLLAAITGTQVCKTSGSRVVQP